MPLNLLAKAQHLPCQIFIRQRRLAAAVMVVNAFVFHADLRRLDGTGDLTCEHMTAVTEAQTPATSMIFENRKSGLSICSGYIASKVFHINDSRFSKSLPLAFNQTNTFLAVQFCE